LWQQLQLRSTGSCFSALTFSFGCFASRLSGSTFLHFSNANTQFLTPFRNRGSRDAWKLDQCRLTCLWIDLGWLLRGGYHRGVTAFDADFRIVGGRAARGTLHQNCLRGSLGRRNNSVAPPSAASQSRRILSGKTLSGQLENKAGVEVVVFSRVSFFSSGILSDRCELNTNDQ